MTMKELIEEVISLPVEERAIVADSILRSLNPPESEIDHKWAQVAQRRLAELRSGEVRPVVGEQVFAKFAGYWGLPGSNRVDEFRLGEGETE